MRILHFTKTEQMKKLLILVIIIIMTAKVNFAQEDPNLWLEDVENPKALEWVGKWNEKSLQVLKSQKNYQAIYDKNLEIYNSVDRIADPEIRGDYIFNFWQDQTNPAGNLATYFCGKLYQWKPCVGNIN